MPARGTRLGERRRRPRETRWWRTHGLPPKSGTVTAAAAQRIAVISSTGRHDFRAGWTGTTGATRAVRSRPSALQVAAARAGRSSSTTRSAARPTGLGPSDSPTTGARGSTPGSTSPPHAALPQPWPLAQVALALHGFRAAARPAAVGRRAMAAAPSAPKPGAVVRPTRRRVPGTGGFPDRLEASSAARRLAGRGESPAPADRVVSLSPSCRAAAGTVSRATVSDSTPTAGGEDGGQVRRPEKSPRGLDRRRAAGSRPGTRARPFPGRARLTGEAGQAATRARFHDACAARRAVMADAPSPPPPAGATARRFAASKAGPLCRHRPGGYRWPEPFTDAR